MLRDVDQMRRLSALLDEALERAEGEREHWLAALPAEARGLTRTLRELLARAATKETADLLDRGPLRDACRSARQ